MESAHVPVMTAEVLGFLEPRSGRAYADATLGRGGHAEAILEASAPDGQLIGVDRDPQAIEESHERLARFGDRVHLVHARFSELSTVLADVGFSRVDGVVADLGVSSPQLDEAHRGFSLQSEGPLDMRMDPTRGETAAALIGRLDDDELANVIYEFGEERYSRRIARSIRRAHAENKLATTADLRRAVHRAVGSARGRIDPATRTFQALRIAVNRELDELREFLHGLPEFLVEGGVAVVISFHSLEDRLVKRAFRSDERLEPLTKRPRTATAEECSANSRARSAKLRAARRVSYEVAA